jgi:hypothetical protein
MANGQHVDVHCMQMDARAVKAVHDMRTTHSLGFRGVLGMDVRIPGGQGASREPQTSLVGAGLRPPADREGSGTRARESTP